MSVYLVASCILMASFAASIEAGPFVRALWLVQRYGTADAADPSNDQRLKGRLAKALGKEGELTFTKLEGLMDASTFKRLAGADDRIDSAEIQSAVEAAVPESRNCLLPKVREHADSLTTSFDMIDESHRVASRSLADWIARNYQPGRELHVTLICTGNSRRSILGSTLGNVAAAYYGMPEICFHSGGTAPTAFNSRTVAALRDIGMVIEPTGKEAERPEPKSENPIYRVRWGTRSESIGAAVDMVEFSKKYDDPANPQQGFAALMVCGEADAACPIVRGAAIRISMPYLDPKIYDGSAFEAVKYAERRDDMWRFLLSAMMQARRRLAVTAGQNVKSE
jgi:protein-tyrosine-phosphatase